MPQRHRRQTWVLALILGAVTVLGSIGVQIAGNPLGHAQAGYLNPPPPPLSVAH